MAKQSIDHSHNISSSGHNLTYSDDIKPSAAKLTAHWKSCCLHTGSVENCKINLQLLPTWFQHRPPTTAHLTPKKSPTALYFLHTITILSTNNSLQPETCLASPDHGCFHGGFIVALKGHSPSYEGFSVSAVHFGGPHTEDPTGFWAACGRPMFKKMRKTRILQRK